MPFNGEMPNQLVQAVAEGKSLAFVGAGFSMPVKRSNGKPLPNWPGLLQELLEMARLENVPFSGLEDELEEAISAGKLIMAAQEIEDRISEPLKAGILTTNYDMLIEGAYTLKYGGRIPPV